LTYCQFKPKEAIMTVEVLIIAALALMASGITATALGGNAGQRDRK
jgi:hypothetical protein